MDNQVILDAFDKWGGEQVIRAAFEQWYSDACEWPDAVKHNGRGEYLYSGTTNAWTAWRAASEWVNGLRK